MKEVQQKDIDVGQLPDWAEFERTSEGQTTVKAKSDFLLEADGGAAFHSNRAFLDVIDQDLAKADAPEFLGVFESSQEITATDNLDPGYTRAHITTANAVTITIPAGMKVGTILSFVRTVSSDKAVTLARSESETIEAGTTWISHQAASAAYINMDAICIKKISSTAWRWVAGAQTGNNSNGEYTRFASGTLICTDSGTVNDWAINNAYGSLYQGSREFTFAYPFAVAPAATCGLCRYGTGAAWPGAASPTTTTVSIRAIDVMSRATGTNVAYSYIAIGSWR